MSLNRLISIFLMLASLFFMVESYAECLTINGQVYCSPPNGSIKLNQVGEILCGVGQCVTNSLGQMLCSSQPGGSAIIAALGNTLCTGGCVPASASLCQIPR